MVNFLALLGWSPGNDIEVMPVPEIIERFTADGLSKNAAVFDLKKLEWMNGQHLSMMLAADLAPLVTRGIVAAGLATEAELAARVPWYFALIELLKVRARTIDDMVRQAVPYLIDGIEYDPDAVAKTWKDAVATRDTLQATRDALAAAPAWDTQPLEDSLRSLAESRGTAAGKIFQPLRLALTGVTASPGIFDVLVMLGRERSLARIDAAVQFLDGQHATRR
jgi:glutamyl-tRNA synthetase